MTNEFYIVIENERMLKEVFAHYDKFGYKFGRYDDIPSLSLDELKTLCHFEKNNTCIFIDKLFKRLTYSNIHYARTCDAKQLNFNSIEKRNFLFKFKNRIYSGRLKKYTADRKAFKLEGFKKIFYLNKVKFI